MKYITNGAGEILNISAMPFIRPAKNRNRGKVYVSSLNTHVPSYVIDISMGVMVQWLSSREPFLEAEFTMTF